MRAGVIQVPNSAGVYVPYNLNPASVTVAGVTYAPAVCPAGRTLSFSRIKSGSHTLVSGDSASLGLSILTIEPK